MTFRVPLSSDPWQVHYEHYWWELHYTMDMEPGRFPPGRQDEMIAERVELLIAISSDE